MTDPELDPVVPELDPVVPELDPVLPELDPDPEPELEMVPELDPDPELEPEPELVPGSSEPSGGDDVAQAEITLAMNNGRSAILVVRLACTGIARNVPRPGAPGKATRVSIASQKAVARAVDYP